MPYLGRPVTNAGQFEIIDDISSGFDGSETSFTLQVGGTDIQPDVANVTITLGGVFQVPSSAYSITGSAINFSEAPESNTTFHGVLAGQSQFIESDFITNTMIKSTAAISGSKIDTDLDTLNELLSEIETGKMASKMIKALKKSKGVQIFIGSNTNLFKNANLSMIFSNYQTKNGLTGAIGVIGPKRIDYQRIVPIVNYMSEIISNKK